jgi:hypothetical protein
MMQYDVKASHFNVSGNAVTSTCRVKGVLSTAGATAGYVNLWDSNAAPLTGTYARANTTVTVSVVAHNLVVGQSFGFAATSNNATDGNYVVASLANANAFTFTDINSGTAAGNCSINTRWLMSWDTANIQSETYMLLPGEGIKANNGVYGELNNVTGVIVFYG